MKTITIDIDTAKISLEAVRNEATRYELLAREADAEAVKGIWASKAIEYGHAAVAIANTIFEAEHKSLH